MKELLHRIRAAWILLHSRNFILIKYDERPKVTTKYKIVSLGNPYNNQLFLLDAYKDNYPDAMRAYDEARMRAAVDQAKEILDR